MKIWRVRRHWKCSKSWGVKRGGVEIRGRVSKMVRWTGLEVVVRSGKKGKRTRSAQVGMKSKRKNLQVTRQSLFSSDEQFVWMFFKCSVTCYRSIRCFAIGQNNDGRFLACGSNLYRVTRKIQCVTVASTVALIFDCQPFFIC